MGCGKCYDQDSRSVEIQKRKTAIRKKLNAEFKKKKKSNGK